MGSEEILISLDRVSINIPVIDANRSFRASLASRFTGGVISREEKKVFVRALDDVSLKLTAGDRVGVLGHNGAGKTTLLRVLAGIYDPTDGTALRNGRITTLFNPSVGMEMDESGRQNIFNVAAFMGISRSEINSRIDDILEFCELGDFIDLPVRTYSSGMLVRLGFAVATSIEPEILILDEGIGAGDARFADKAQARMDKFFGRTKTMVFASHGFDQIRKLCNRAILLEHGKLVFDGSVEETIEEYARLRADTGV